MACQASKDYIVAGDIGGTNARFQLWEIDRKNGSKALLFQQKYPTNMYATFLEALSTFEKDSSIGEQYEKPKAAAFAAAGVVYANKLCKMTNLNWTLDSEEIENAIGWKNVNILNDFEAIGYGSLIVDEAHIYTVHAGTTTPRGPKVVLGPGTGFGQAQLFWNEKVEDYTVMPSEGAHGDFSPRGSKQHSLSMFVEQKHGYCEVEHVCCGPGLETIYEFLHSLEKTDNEMTLSAPDIAKAALSGTNDIAYEAVEMFLSILGQEASNWALRSLARGGVYIAGGITPKLIPILEKGSLEEAYLHKESRFTEVLQSIPLKLITTDDIGLSGSCLYAERNM